ncbi:MAG: DUF2155 domain-containing protein [Geminicoccaceae bacterium]|nr:DUF2155 domain-containing protein [Geminicoccaceae bacterium]
MSKGGLLLLGGLCAGAATADAAAVLEHEVAVLQGLDKVTARVSPVRAPLDEPIRFGRLEITVRACRETPPTEPPESAAFLEIRELPPKSEETERAPVQLFSGWMFASSPAISALEHPVYDLWVLDCEEPVELPAGAQGGTEGTAPRSE